MLWCKPTDTTYMAVLWRYCATGWFWWINGLRVVAMWSSSSFTKSDQGSGDERANTFLVSNESRVLPLGPSSFCLETQIKNSVSKRNIYLKDKYLFGILCNFSYAPVPLAGDATALMRRTKKLTDTQQDRRDGLVEHLRCYYFACVAYQQRIKDAWVTHMRRIWRMNGDATAYDVAYKNLTKCAVQTPTAPSMRGVYAACTWMIAAHTRMYAAHTRMIATPAQDIDTPLLNKCQILAVCSISICTNKKTNTILTIFIRYLLTIANTCRMFINVLLCKEM